MGANNVSIKNHVKEIIKNLESVNQNLEALVILIAELFKTTSNVSVVVQKEQNLDASGVAWDAEIHAAGKTKNSDGMWRITRGIKLGDIMKAPPDFHDLITHLQEKRPKNLHKILEKYKIETVADLIDATSAKIKKVIKNVA